MTRFCSRPLIAAAAIALTAMLGGCVYYPGYGYGYGYPYGYAYPYGYSYAYAPTFSFAVGGWGGGWNDHYWHGGRWGWYR
ncbi:MAG: hypothetical protein JO122_16275 [Acetobacteraceae bacterium]|nr:hypothetical protein [Acetobacteraceae bacterium]